MKYPLPEISLDSCTGCGFCEKYCPVNAVEMQQKKPVIVKPNDCVYCGICEEFCPTGAVSLVYQIGSSNHIL